MVERNLAKVDVAGSSPVSRSKRDKNMQYQVNIKKSDGGYSVWCPGLPGCWSQGLTEDEALENIKDAIKSYVETAHELIKDEETRLV